MIISSGILYSDDIVQGDNNQVAMVGDVVRWVLDSIPGLKEIKQDLLDIVYTYNI